MDAFRNAPREKIVYVTGIYKNTPNSHLPDFIATVDVDPDSPTCSQVRCVDCRPCFVDMVVKIDFVKITKPTAHEFSVTRPK